MLYIFDVRFLVINNDGFEKFVVFVFVIMFFDGFDWVGVFFVFVEDKVFESDFDMFLFFVMVYGIVFVDNGGNFINIKFFDFGEQFFQVIGIGFGVGVMVIIKEVDVDFGDVILFGSFEESIKMGLFGVLLL